MSTYKRRDRKFEEHIAQLVDAKIPVKYHCVCRNYQGECEDECAEFNAKRDPTHLPSKYSWVSLKDWLRVWWRGFVKDHIVDDYENLWPDGE